MNFAEGFNNTPTYSTYSYNTQSGIYDSPVSGNAPLGVWYWDTSFGADSEQWTFGDGGSSSARGGYYVYEAPGTYTLTQSVQGTGSASSSLVVKITPATNYWVGATGDWDSASNWSLGHVPTALENAVINAAGSYTVSHSTDAADSVYSLVSNAPITFAAGSLNVATTLHVNGSFTLSGTGVLSASGNEYVGYTGTGALTQTGGQNTCAGLYLGYSASDSGSYNLQGGSLSAPNETVGYNGSGTFTQAGGTNTVATAGTLALATYAGSTGTYDLNGGTVTAPEITVGIGGASEALAASQGSFIQSGGTVSAGTLVVGYLTGSSGQYALSETGSLSLSNILLVGGGNTNQTDVTGTFTQSGGNVTITTSSTGLVLGNAPDSTGSYSLAEGTLKVSGGAEVIGNYGTGAFTQAGGTHTVTGQLILGYNSGSTGNYNLGGTGALSVGNESIGYNGSGTFTQTGGTNTVNSGGSLLVGNATSTSGYTLSGIGSLSVSGSEAIGSSGSFTLEGRADFGSHGNFSNSGTLTIGPSSTLSVKGNLTEGSAATLVSEIGGTPGSGSFGIVASTGAAALAGTLTVTLVNGFVPSASSYSLVTFPTHTGAFSAYNLPSVVGMTLTPTTNSAGVGLTVSAATGPAQQLAFTQPPAGAPVGETLAAVAVSVEDSSGNTVTTDSSTVILTLSSGVFSTGSATATAAAVSGVATFSGLSINSPGTYAITAADGSLTAVTSAPFTVTAPPPALIGGPVINGDDPNGLSAGVQRSMVEDVVYTFGSAVTIPNADAAFTVLGAGSHPGPAPTALSATAVPGSNGTQWAVTLTGAAPGALGSIANGEYSITINPGAVFAASDGVTQLAAGRTDQFYRLFGDINGDETVNAADNLQLKKALTNYNPAFDSNADGTVNAADNLAFKKDLTVAYFGDGFVPTI